MISLFLDLKLKLRSQSYDLRPPKCHRGTPTWAPYRALASHFFDQKCVTLASIRGTGVPRSAKMPPWYPYSLPLYLGRLWTPFTCIMVLFYRAQSFSFSILMIFLFFGLKIEAP